MQTFIVDHSMARSAHLLDSKRLGKQRVEALQIYSTLSGRSIGWANHPAVKMWLGHEGFLLSHYTQAVLIEWKLRGFDPGKSQKKFNFFVREITLLPESFFVKPDWLTDEFIRAHRSNLTRKNPEFYGPIWPDVPSNLPYIWPR